MISDEFMNDLHRSFFFTIKRISLVSKKTEDKEILERQNALFCLCQYSAILLFAPFFVEEKGMERNGSIFDRIVFLDGRRTMAGRLMTHKREDELDLVRASPDRSRQLPCRSICLLCAARAPFSPSLLM